VRAATPGLRGDLVILYVATSEGPPRAGFVTGRKLGGAVQRNRARRLLREAWRALVPRMRGSHDVVVVARPSIEGAKAQAVKSDLENLLARARVLDA
jgi:ribonuclease P protein component